jgi:hypothetical protein
MRMTLAALQHAFGAQATGRPSGAEQLVYGAGTLSPAASLELYANMFLWRQIDSLFDDFPKLAALTGDSFYRLCEAYLAQYPSRHPSLSRLGHAMSSFLATHRGLRADLSDLAALEAARNDVFDEQSVAVATAPGADDQPLTLIPALRCLWLAHDVTALWKAVEDDLSAPEPLRTQSCLVAWRKGFEVFHVRVDAFEAEALARAAAGRPLSEICEAFAEHPAPFAAAARAIGSWFAESWIAQGETHD